LQIAPVRIQVDVDGCGDGEGSSEGELQQNTDRIRAINTLFFMGVRGFLKKGSSTVVEWRATSN
jgi:hypothetical protein